MQNNIKICSRTYGGKLFGECKKFITLPYEIIPFTNCDHKSYIEKILCLDTDFVINIDEDCFICDNNEVEYLLQYMIDNNYDYCGSPDGGLYEIRRGSPIVMNPFFNIFNVKNIRPRFEQEINNIPKSPCDILNPQDEKLLSKVSFELEYGSFENLKGQFFNPSVERYYPLFYWLAENFSPLYLDGRTYNDGWTSIVHSPRGNEICYHTWFVRHYKDNKKHREKSQRERINKVISYVRGLKENKK